MRETGAARGLLPPGASVRRDLALLSLFVCAAAIPFLTQPFHMDDNFYLDMARNARVKPLYPNDVAYTFMGESLADMGSHSHPPLQTYFLAGLLTIAAEEGDPEALFHAAALVFPLVAVISFYFIAARWVQRPLWPAMMLAASPLFLVMQHSLMTDLPTLAYWLAAIACFLWAVDHGSVRLHAASALFQFAAVFTSYQSIALTPLLAFYLWRRKASAKEWFFLCLPPAMMAGWFGLGYAHYRRFLLFDTAGYILSRDSTGIPTLVQKLLAAVQYQGWLSICPPFLVYLWARCWRWRMFWLVTVAAMFVVQWVAPEYRLIDKAIFIAGAVAGACVAMRAFRWAADAIFGRRPGNVRTEDQFLALWYFGVLAYCLILFTEGSARYVLPLLPPVILMFFRDLEEREVIEYRLGRRFLLSSAMVASGSLVLSLALGLALSHADLEFARIYKRAAQDFAHISGKMRSWFGGEWGFRYYFARAGARQIRGDEREMLGGDWVVLPRLALPYEIPPPVASMLVPVLTMEYEPATPLRLLDHQSPAGFYSTGWGLLPFSLSRKALEEVGVSQIDFLVEGLPRARVSAPEGESKPFGTLCDLQGTRRLGLRGYNSAIRLAYGMEMDGPLRLDVHCGVPDGGRRRESVVFTLSQADPQGELLCQSSIRLSPGKEPRDRGWHPLALDLRAARGVGSVRLEVAVEGERPGSSGSWFVAGAVLRPGGGR